MVQFSARRDVVAGFEIETRTAGEGPNLLYLHGAGGAGSFFAGGDVAPFLAKLAASHSVLVPEHPGFGPNDGPDWLDNIHDVAYFYLDYLAALGLDGVHLVASSLGGWIALELAVRDTSRLKTLTLCGTAGLKVKGVPMGDTFLWNREEFAENFMMNRQARAKFLAAEPTPEQEVIGLRNRQTTALLAWKPRFHNPHLTKWLHRIDVPTHILWAEDDRVFPMPYGEALAGHIEGSTLSVLPGTGHLMQTDDPQAFCDAVTKFIGDNAS
ncbi:MAG: alpha/beta hydrolase [Alphaproteobacteria bacterium]|nr:alpha/beta hydrolase [Alphaproteobacteria bacterium]